MGYTLKIGELSSHIEDSDGEKYLFFDVEPIIDYKAPAFGEPTDYTNERWPSYSSWNDAMRFVGLHELMYGEEGILREHPGCFSLTVDHKREIDRAYKSFYEKYPDCKAGYSPKIDFKSLVFDDPEWPKENSYATRLEWLKYWVDWALDNCKQPVFCNS